MRAFGDNIYTNFCALNVPEDGVKYYFTIIYIDPVPVYESKYSLQVYLDNSAYENVDKQLNIVMNIFLIQVKFSFLILINGS